MAGAKPTASDERRWLTLDTGQRLPMPAVLQGESPQTQVARDAWRGMHIAGDAAREAARQFGATSREARRWRSQARRHQEQLEAALGERHEDLVARMGKRTKAGLDAIALLRY